MNANYDKALRKIKRFIKAREKRAQINPANRVSIVELEGFDDDCEAFYNLFMKCRSKLPDWTTWANHNTPSQKNSNKDKL